MTNKKARKDAMRKGDKRLLIMAVIAVLVILSIYVLMD